MQLQETWFKEMLQEFILGNYGEGQDKKTERFLSYLQNNKTEILGLNYPESLVNLYTEPFWDTVARSATDRLTRRPAGWP